MYLSPFLNEIKYKRIAIYKDVTPSYIASKNCETI